MRLSGRLVILIIAKAENPVADQIKIFRCGCTLARTHNTVTHSCRVPTPRHFCALRHGAHKFHEQAFLFGKKIGR